MGRYRKIDPRIWGDDKFRSLSRPQPNGQTLWFYLLTGPHTNGCPGIYHLGELGLSESLGWPLKAFRKVFQEVLTEGLAKADWEARVIVIFNVFKKYDKPESPNVVKFWGKFFDEIPECLLKVEYFKELKAFIEGLGEGFKEAFREAFGESIPEPFLNHSNKKTLAQNSLREGVQDSFLQEAVPSSPESPQKAKTRTGHNGMGQDLRERFKSFWAVYPKKRSMGKAEKVWMKINPDEQLLARILATIEQAKKSEGWLKDGGQFIPYPATWLNAKGWEDEIKTAEEGWTDKVKSML